MLLLDEVSRGPERMNMGGPWARRRGVEGSGAWALPGRMKARGQGCKRSV